MLEHMQFETQALALQAKRARLLDHDTNRGSEAEHAILRWLRERFAPEYTVSTGEIIDGYDTNAGFESRQLDGVLHRNDALARRFLLPSGLRLIPVETVAAVVEVKLSLSKPEVRKADVAPAQTARLRYAFREGSLAPDGVFARTTVTQKENKSGVPMTDARMRSGQPTFAVFGYDDNVKPERLAGWLKETQAVNVLCCLNGGFASRAWRMSVTGVSFLAQAKHALGAFAERMAGAISVHSDWYRVLELDSERYARHVLLPYWDETHYEWPPDYTPTAEQIELRARLYEELPELRPREKRRGKRGMEAPRGAKRRVRTRR